MTNLLGVTQVAERLGVTPRTVQRAINGGDLPAIKLPGRTGAYVVAESDVKEYEARRAEQASA